MMHKHGLYDPSFEKDSCGIGFVAHLKGIKSHAIVEKGLRLLDGLTHRGAEGCDPCTGDGAGILLQIPHAFFQAQFQSATVRIPAEGAYGVGMFFLPTHPDDFKTCDTSIRSVLREEGMLFLGWRDVPVDASIIGPQARGSMPAIKQLFVTPNTPTVPGEAFERQLYVLRKRIEKTIAAKRLKNRESFYIVSLSHRTIIYKGLLRPDQVADFYPDLRDPRFVSALALVHSRFSTNTFPTWSLAHPFRFICHNGEINTVQGNRHWMRARQGKLSSEHFGEKIEELFPIIAENQSDSACLDNALEFLVMGGRSLPHAMMMLIPEPWNANPEMDLDRRGFYEYHSAMMEPWDGPAAVCFTDGKTIGATLDRNGLRPCRYRVTADDLVILASEAGVIADPAEKIVKKGRLHPGRMFLVDLEKGRIVDDEEVKSEISRAQPYRAWVQQDRVSLDELPEPLSIPQPDPAALALRQRIFGYTQEELTRVLMPMAINGEEPTSSMGSDTPLAVLSERPQLLFKYFRQMFAQVTNPPIDPIREQLVMSLVTSIGPRPNLLQETPGNSRRIKTSQPFLTNAELKKIREISDPRFKTKTLRMVFRASRGPEGLRAGVIELCRQASQAVREGHQFLILSDRTVSAEWAPIPSILAVSAVHHHLVLKSRRAEVGIIVETGEARDVHHMACLIGYGAGTINPYLVLETFEDLQRAGKLPEGIDGPTAQGKYIKALNKGLLKVLSKMGISTVQSYCGSQIFEAIGLGPDVIRRNFTGTPSRIGGIGMTELGEETLRRHAAAFQTETLEIGGEIHYRAQSEFHQWNPETIARLQHATQCGDATTYRQFAELVNQESQHRATLRGLIDFVPVAKPIPITEVESAAEIVKRFTTGAMSMGAISREAHETLAIAMNRIGGKSNSGEGGEDPNRFWTAPNGDSKNSAIKQIASGRFGVTAHYLVNAREIQIKMAQGAKPGEGGQLPGYKVDEHIAKLRYSTPGVQLISPPPHHDIYSIEDLAQLIFDLKNVNPQAAVSVKLVSEVGVGTIAAGVAKAYANKILISGDSGGTGASPLSSIKYAGIPWEMGLAETHQTLLLNGLRGRVRIETDGQMKTGRDVVIAALLGADEYGFATAPLIVEGCIMMRKCHLNTCPVGIATQDEELRRKFRGQPEHVVNYFFFVAEEAREIMASLGFRTFAEMIGRKEALKATVDASHWKAKGLDLSPLLQVPASAPEQSELTPIPDLRLADVMDHALIAQIPTGGSTTAIPIRNTDRAVGAMLSGTIVKKYGPEGAPGGGLHYAFSGSAGQSFGAFLARGITLYLTGESNDYLGKSLSGGRIIVRPPQDLATPPEETILIGNTALYGATGGEVFLSGIAGERFAVRNSGAHAVVEGTGDHGCEYMTGGIVVVLGSTGRNFAAGMSGGFAFVLDENGKFESRCNLAMIEIERELSAEDEQTLRKLVTAHAHHTQSPKAQKLLADWESARMQFVKIMPTDYKNVLRQRAEALKASRTKSTAQEVPIG